MIFVPQGADPAAPPAIDPIVLARQLRNRLDLPAPVVGVSPDGKHENPALVNLPTWWWVSGSEPVSQRTSLGAVWAEVTARPVSSRWRASDGSSKSCPGLGVAWRTGLPEDAAGSCRYTYDHSNASEVARVSVTWEVTWVGSGGSGGTLDPFVLSSEVPVPVYERHALRVG